jgi:hypothetical protein
MNDIDNKLRNETLSLRNISDAALILEFDDRVEMAKKIKHLEAKLQVAVEALETITTHLGEGYNITYPTRSTQLAEATLLKIKAKL